MLFKSQNNVKPQMEGGTAIRHYPFWKGGPPSLGLCEKGEEDRRAPMSCSTNPQRESTHLGEWLTPLGPLMQAGSRFRPAPQGQVGALRQLEAGAQAVGGHQRLGDLRREPHRGRQRLRVIAWRAAPNRTPNRSPTNRSPWSSDLLGFWLPRKCLVYVGVFLFLLWALPPEMVGFL